MALAPRLLPPSGRIFQRGADLPDNRVTGIEGGVQPKLLTIKPPLIVGRNMMFLSAFKEQGLLDPLHKHDCCLVTDGGGAIVLTRPDHASALRRPPVHVLGVGEAQWHRWIAQMPDLTVTAATDSGKRAFEMAGLTPRDVDVVQLYDAFSINPILFLEDLGFCPKGEGGRFVADGKLAPGGSLPMNTNGGGLSYGHPGMYGIFTLIEATRQLRGEANARQVSGCEIALAHGNGGWLSSQVTALLGTSAAL